MCALVVVSVSAGYTQIRICNYPDFNTRCARSKQTSCVEYRDGVCSRHSECATTNLCYGVYTLLNETTVRTDHFFDTNATCNGTPAFSLDLPIDECHLYLVFGEQFRLRVTINEVEEPSSDAVSVHQGYSALLFLISILSTVIQ